MAGARDDDELEALGSAGLDDVVGGGRGGAEDVEMLGLPTGVGELHLLGGAAGEGEMERWGRGSGAREGGGTNDGSRMFRSRADRRGRGGARAYLPPALYTSILMVMFWPMTS